MRFVVDAQLPPRLADWIRAKGHDAEHVASVLGESTPDRTILRYAAKHGAIIVSKDWDFFDLVDDDEAPSQPLLWIGIGNTINRVLFALLETEWPRIEDELRAGAQVVLLKD